MANAISSWGLEVESDKVKGDFFTKTNLIPSNITIYTNPTRAEIKAAIRKELAKIAQEAIIKMGAVAEQYKDHFPKNETLLVLTCNLNRLKEQSK